MEIEKILYKIMIVLFIIGLFGLGWCGNDYYKDYTNQKMYNGLRFVNNNSYAEAMKTAYNIDDYADWVCVNVKGMQYKDALETCSHEVGHEIFATYCGSHINKCMEITNET